MYLIILITMAIVLVNDYLNGLLHEKKVFWNYLLDGISDLKPIDIPIMKAEGIYNDYVGFEDNVANYITNVYPDCKLIIQNGSYFNLIPFNAKKIILIQDNLRKIRCNDNIAQEENFYNADYIVCNSKEIEDYYYERKMVNIPLGVDSDFFTPISTQKDKVILQMEMDIPCYAYKNVGIFVGSFTEIKGWETMKSIVERRKDIFWILVTKHDDEDYNSVNSRVYKKISQETLVKLLNCSDFFVLPSPSESQCLSAIEANLCNIPVLMKETGYLTGLGVDEKNNVGVITETFTDDDINKIINGSFNPREVAMKLFSINGMVNKWSNLIQCVYYANNNFDLTNTFTSNSLQIRFQADFVDKILNYFYKKDDYFTFLEIGGLEGDNSCYLKSKYNNADVYCVEASTEIFTKSLNEKRNKIKVFNDCIYNRNGIVCFHLKENVFNGIYSGIHSVYNRGNEYGYKKEFIRCKTLDTFCIEQNIDKIDVLNIEACGTTFDILNNCNILSNTKILLIQTENYPFFENQILDKDVNVLLINKGFKLISKVGYYILSQGKQFHGLWINTNCKLFENIQFNKKKNDEITWYEKKTISYVCLIYRSVNYLKFVYEQFHKFTTLYDGDEFYFVANDPTDAVLDYLRNNNIKHYVHINTEEQKKEWYINNVYRAWNTAGRNAKGDYVVFLNSDFAFSENWSENLQKNIRDDICLCSRLVERGLEDGGLDSGKYGIEKSFGNSTTNYREQDFIDFANGIRESKVCSGGLFMPLMIKKLHLEQINYYPEGNIIKGSNIFNPIYATQKDVYENGIECISGDVVLMEKLKTIGVEHYTCFDSIVYHFQQGESTEE